MKRTLSVLTLAAALAMVGGAIAATRLHAAKPYGHASAQPASASACADPSRCPAGPCPTGSMSAAAVGLAPAAQEGAACTSPAACTNPSWCPQGTASTTVAVATNQ